ncbi:MAG: putative transcriptional regulator of viral defense system [Candidatus Omnitrophota bacterium]|jgi:predicted transcriptional regulator of viral defense system
MNVLAGKIIESIPSDVFSDTIVKQLVKGSNASRYGLIQRAIQSGQIIHLRRGLYALSEKFRRKPFNLYEIAQKIYGPSYVSCESALAYHGWIPEAVYTITNVSSKRSLEFETQVGNFSYFHIPSNNFLAGVQRMESESGAYLMATPWRALIDYVYMHKKKWRGLEPLLNDMRIDEDKFQDVDFGVLEELYLASRSKQVQSFITSIKKELLR